MDLNQVSAALVDRLLPLQEELHLVVEALPPDVDAGAVANDRIWVAFRGDRPAPPIQIEPIIQRVELDFELFVRVQGLSGSDNAAKAALDRARALCSGFVVTEPAGDLYGFTRFEDAYCVGSRFLDLEDGFWTFSLGVRLPCLYIAPRS